MIRAIARDIRNKSSERFELDDLVSAGVVGCYDALHRFNESSGASFQTFARYRVRGAILDWIENEYRYATRHVCDPLLAA